MADVVGGPDPNEDFQAALANAAGVEVPAEQTSPDVSTEVSAGLTGLEEQPRDEQGRFAGSPAESSEEQPAEVPEEGQTEAEEEAPAQNEALNALIEQYGGDANAALEALVQERDNAQSLIGRQGSELGDLRSRLDQLQGYVEAIGNQPQQTPDLPLVNDEVVEGLESLHESRGARGMMEWVIENRPDLIDTAEQVWAAEDPVTAAGFRARREAFEVLGTQQEAPQPQIDPIIESMRQERALGNAIDQARNDLGISESDWAAVRDQITPAFEDDNTPSLIKNAVVSTDPEQQLEGMRNLMQVARARAVATATANATQQASQVASQAAVERKKAATVVSGSLRPAGASTQGQPEGEMTSEERQGAFKKALMATEVTSVSDGLTGLK